MDVEKAYVLWFDELHRKDVALVGGKSSFRESDRLDPASFYWKPQLAGTVFSRNTLAGKFFRSHRPLASSPFQLKPNYANTIPTQLDRIISNPGTYLPDTDTRLHQSGFSH